MPTDKRQKYRKTRGENKGAKGFISAGRIGFVSFSRCVDWRAAESLTIPSDSRTQEGEKGVSCAFVSFLCVPLSPLSPPPETRHHLGLI